MSLAARLVQWLRPARPPETRCARCRHFRNEPFHLERAMPGYAALSSALGATRAEDGQCELHQRCVAARGGCDAFAGHASRAVASNLTGHIGPAAATVIR